MEIANQIVNWLSLVTIIIAFVISVLYQSRKNLLPIQLYIIVSIVANLILNIFDLLPIKSSYKNIEQVSFNIYSLLEISLIYYFLFISIKGKGFRTTMLISLFIFLSICIVGWTLSSTLFFYFASELSG